MAGYDPVRELSQPLPSPTLPSSTNRSSSRHQSHADISDTSQPPEGHEDDDFDEFNHRRRPSSRSASIVSLLNPAVSSKDERPTSSGSTHFARNEEPHSFHHSPQSYHPQLSSPSYPSHRRISIDGLVATSSPDSQHSISHHSYAPASGLAWQSSHPRRSPSLHLSSVLNPSPSSSSHRPLSRPMSAQNQHNIADDRVSMPLNSPRASEDGERIQTYRSEAATDHAQRLALRPGGQSPTFSAGESPSQAQFYYSAFPQTDSAHSGSQHYPAHHPGSLGTQSPHATGTTHSASAHMATSFTRTPHATVPTGARSADGFRVPSLPSHRSPEVRRIPLPTPMSPSGPYPSRAEHREGQSPIVADQAGQFPRYSRQTSLTPTVSTPGGFPASASSGLNTEYFRMPQTPGERDPLPPPLTPGIPTTPGARGNSTHPNGEMSEKLFSRSSSDRSDRIWEHSIKPSGNASERTKQHSIHGEERPTADRKSRHTPDLEQVISEAPIKERASLRRSPGLAREGHSHMTANEGNAGTIETTEQESVSRVNRNAETTDTRYDVSSPPPTLSRGKPTAASFQEETAAGVPSKPLTLEGEREEDNDSAKNVTEASDGPQADLAKGAQRPSDETTAHSGGKVKILELDEVDRLATRDDKKRKSSAAHFEPATSGKGKIQRTKPTDGSDELSPRNTLQSSSSLPHKPSADAQTAVERDYKKPTVSAVTPYQPTKRVSQPNSIRRPLSRDDLVRLQETVEARGANTLRRNWRDQQRHEGRAQAKEGFWEVIVSRWGEKPTGPDSFNIKAASATATADSASEVARHYNNRQETGLLARNSSPILPLKNFNNWVKSVLIGSFGKRGGRAMDMGGGKGGDLQKWDKLGVRELVLADIAATSVEQAEARYRERRFRWRASFWALDCFGESLADRLPADVLYEPFDTVSLQFCMHYGWSSLQRARLVIENISRYMGKGAVFIGTIPNQAELYNRLDALPQGHLEFGNTKYHVKFEQRDKKKPFGDKYTFFLDDAVDEVPEYVVDWDQFQSLAWEYGLELVFKQTMAEVWSSHRSIPEFENLARRMKVSANPRRDVDRPAEMDDDLWEATTLYLAFAFRKVR